MPMPPKPVVLCILDGWGKRADPTANAPLLANTPAFDSILANCPSAELITHGPDVGLPTGQMGNSEVGHTNIGAGRVVAMDLGMKLGVLRGKLEPQEHVSRFQIVVNQARSLELGHRFADLGTAGGGLEHR